MQIIIHNNIIISAATRTISLSNIKWVRRILILNCWSVEQFHYWDMYHQVLHVHEPPGYLFIVQVEFRLWCRSTKVVNKRNLFSVCISTGLVRMRLCHCLIQSWKPLQMWDKWLDRLQVCQRITLLRVQLFSQRCKSYRPVNDLVPARINNVMWWHPSLHERLSTRAKALVVIATTGA